MKSTAAHPLELEPAKMLRAPLAQLLRAWRGRSRFYGAEGCLERVELPCILAAYQCAREGRTRELMALDRALAGGAPWLAYREISRAVGHRILLGLAPLRDDRMMARYLKAVDSGGSPGHHLVVYGLLMAIYGQPLRQGLADYALTCGVEEPARVQAAVARLVP